jgi:hypothetical protein
VRSFAVALALLLAFLTGTLTLEAYAGRAVAFAPDAAGRALDAALDQPDLVQQVMARAVPGYELLPGPERLAVDQLARTDAAHRVARQVRLDADGTVALTPLQRQLTRSLRGLGLEPLADIVTAAGPGRVTVPASYLDRYRQARDLSRLVLVAGAVVTALLVVLALLVSPDRLRTLRTIGLTALLCCVAAAVVYWALPGVATLVGSSSAAEVVAAVIRDGRPTVLARLAPVAVAGLVLAVVAALGRRA